MIVKFCVTEVPSTLISWCYSRLMSRRVFHISSMKLSILVGYEIIACMCGRDYAPDRILETLDPESQTLNEGFRV